MKKHMCASEPRQERDLLLFRVTCPFVKASMCRQTSLWIDIRDHHMEKEEGECQVTDAWQNDKLAQRLGQEARVSGSVDTHPVYSVEESPFTIQKRIYTQNTFRKRHIGSSTQYGLNV